MMHVTHVTIGLGAVRAAETLWRRAGGSVAVRIDYRFAAAGALLPDAIDQPLKHILFPGEFADAHVYGHTLLLPSLLILTGLLLARHGDLRLLVLGIACLSHTLVDPVTTYPETLFWPLFGTDFPEATQSYREYYQPMIEAVLVATYVVALASSERWREREMRFLRYGSFPGEDSDPERGQVQA
ncbi:MAG TPA: metal-dependent hydrolase [Dehalococcoidia bacterium]|nr:metal-dependent hydrolase [Dehalococcoidia bacterium]